MGPNFTVACLVNGNVVGWGDNSRNQVLRSSQSYETSPYTLPYSELDDIVAVVCGNSHVCALDRWRGCLCLGVNDYGQCGIDPTVNTTVTTPNLIQSGVSQIGSRCSAQSLADEYGTDIEAYGLNGNG